MSRERSKMYKYPVRPILVLRIPARVLEERSLMEQPMTPRTSLDEPRIKAVKVTTKAPVRTDR